MRLRRRGRDLREAHVDRHPFVVEGRRLQDDPRRADQHREGEYPEEEPVEDHRYVLPVLLHLRKKGERLTVDVLRLNRRSFALRARCVTDVRPMAAKSLRSFKLHC